MRAIITLIIATGFVAASSLAIAENTPAEPVKAEATATSAASDNSTVTAKPATQEKITAPAVSGLDQPLCVQK